MCPGDVSEPEGCGGGLVSDGTSERTGRHDVHMPDIMGQGFVGVL